MALPGADWKHWYHAMHREKYRATGTEFETYVVSLLTRFHPGFMNPTPAGTLGDGVSDGLAESSTVCYACYGTRAKDSERAVASKIESDFVRGIASWSTVNQWRFITNTALGPIALNYVAKIQQDHRPSSKRPLQIGVWDSEKVWLEVVIKLSGDQLDDVFPGAPGARDVQLSDVVPMLEALTDEHDSVGNGGAIPPVPLGKVEFNKLHELSQLELNEGRRLATRIANWYANVGEPDLYDQHAARFRAIYDEHRKSAGDTRAILEGIYVAVGGDNFRSDTKRANCVYAITAYFFDECDIFERPPADYIPGGVSDVATDQGD